MSFGILKNLEFNNRHIKIETDSYIIQIDVISRFTNLYFDDYSTIKPRILGKSIENIYISYDHELSEITDRFDINSGMIDIRFSNSTLIHIDVFDEIGDDDTDNLQIMVIKLY